MRFQHREAVLKMRARFHAPASSFLALACLLAGCKEEIAKAPPAPPDVKVATVLERDVPLYVQAIGETRGNTEIEIRARVEGFIESVDYKEGSLVEKGQPLYTIDDRVTTDLFERLPWLAQRYQSEKASGRSEIRGVLQLPAWTLTREIEP